MVVVVLLVGMLSAVGSSAAWATPSDASWAGDFGVPGLNSSPSAVAVSGSKVFAGGSFTTIEQVPGYNHIAEWTGHGWIPLGTGVNGPVNAIAVVGGTVYVGGQFTQAGSAAVSNLAAWNGTSWSAVGGGVGAVGSGSVSTLAYAGGVLYVGGSFGSVDGTKVAANSIAAYTVATSGWSALGAGVSNCTGCSWASVNAMTWDPVLQKLFVTGGFKIAGSTTVNAFASWDGANWQGYGTGLTRSNGTPGTGYALAVDPTSGAVYVGGLNIQLAGGVIAVDLAELSGSTWSSPGSITFANNSQAEVKGLALVGSTLYVTGQFDTAGGAPASSLASETGGTWRQVGSGLNFGTGFALAHYGSGSLVVAGTFQYSGSTALNYIGLWTGARWGVFGQGVLKQSTTAGQVNALAASGSGTYAAGSFTQAGVVPANSIARWSGTGWAPLLGGVKRNGVAGIVDAMTMIGGNLYVGGSFTSAGPVAANNIAMWDGTAWHALGAGVDSNVFALTSVNGRLYAGGSFGNAGGKPATEVASYDPATGHWHPLGQNASYGPIGNVQALANYGNRYLLIGGSFPTIGNTVAGPYGTAYGFAYFDTTATAFPLPTSGYTFPGGVSGNGATVHTIQVMPNGPNGDVYVGGSFANAGVSSSSGGTPASNIADWETVPGGNAGTPSWAALGSGVNGAVTGLAETSRTTLGAASTPVLYLAGSFTTAGVTSTRGVASYTPSTRLWGALGSGLGQSNGSAAAGQTLAQNGAGGLFVGGQFLTAGIAPADGLALWTATGGLAP